MKICIVSSDFGYGSDLMYYEEIFKEIHSQNPDFLVALRVQKGSDALATPGAAPMLSGWSLKKIREVNGNDYPTEMFIPSLPSVWRILREKPDVMVSIEFTPISCVALLLTKVFGGKSNLLLVESDPRGRGGKVNGLALILKRFFVRFADCIQTNTNAGKSYVVDDLFASKENVIVAPYLTSQPSSNTHDLPIDHLDNQITLVFCNSATHRKGLDVLTDAVIRLSDETKKQIKVNIVGDGPLLNECKYKLRDSGGKLDVTFHGRLSYSEIGSVLANSDIYISATRADYRSLGTFEALAHSLAIIGTREDGATTETIEHGSNGYILIAGDAHSLSRCIEQLVGERALLQRMRKRSAEMYVEKELSAKFVARNIIQSCKQSLATTKYRD